MDIVKLCAILFNVVGIPLNAMVILIVKRTTSMQSTTNILLCNIALADIFMTLWQLQFLGNHDDRTGVLGTIICKIGRDEVFSAVQALTFTLIAFERYMALFKPMITHLRINRENIWYVIAGLWICSALVFSLPHIIFKELSFDENSLPVCRLSFSETSKAIYFGVIEFFFATNVAVTSFCYLSIVKGMCCDNTICSETVETKQEADEKRRIVAFLLLLTFIFMLAFIPYIVYKTFAFYFCEINIKHKQYLSFPVFMFPVLNPLLYVVFNSNYRAGFKKIVNDIKTFACQTWESLHC